MRAFPQIRHGIVFDLEFTAWEGSMAHRWSRPGEFAELVQVGAVKVDAENLTVLDTLDVLVRPRLNPLLSDYFTALTGIADADLAARGVDFVEAYEAFVAFADGAVTLAFGTDDLVFKDNMRLYGLDDMAPFPPFANLRPWFDANGVATAKLHSCDVGPLLGTPFEGRRHNALADSLSLVAGIRALVARGAPNPVDGPVTR
jgi:inhibitor of KinA sporulation pathway (predicted exonuclease)